MIEIDQETFQMKEDLYLSLDELQYPLAERQILCALRYLADNDDGAEEKDHAGFSRIDGEFGRDLAAKEYPLTAKQLLAAHKVCKKYLRTQLIPAGFSLPEDADVQEVARNKEEAWQRSRQSSTNLSHMSQPTKTQARVIGLKNGMLGVIFPSQVSDFQANLGKIHEMQREVEGLRLLRPDLARVAFVEDEKDGKVFKYWQCPLEFVERIVQAFPDFKVTPDVLRIIDEEAERKAAEQRALEEAAMRNRERIERLMAVLGDLNAPIGERSLFAHQKEAIERMIEWGSGIIAYDQGLGKTMIGSMIAFAYKKAENCRAIIAGPKTMRGAWIEEAGRVGVPIEYYPHDSIPEDVPGKYILIVDECFPAGTMVLTDQGPISIDRIVNEQMDVQIASCNLETGDFEYKPVVRYIRKPLKGSLVKVTHENGSFVCTPNHKIWTEEAGYVTAGALKSRTNLRMVRKAIPDPDQGKEYCTVLHEELCCTGNKQSPRSSGVSNQACSQTNDRQNMQMVSETFSNKVIGEGQRKAKILQCDMLNILEVQSARSQSENQQAEKRATRHNSRDEVPKWKGIDTHARGGQSYKKSHTQREDTTEIDRENFSSKGRQWQTYRTSDPLGGCIEVAYGASYCDSSGQGNVPLSSHLLQSRYSRPHMQSSNRGGWAIAQAQEMEFSRHAQNGDIKCSRVVCVEIYERGSHGRSFASSERNTTVYNLEVADNHNYIADGILVSNCDAYQNMRAKRTQKFIELAMNAVAVFPMSGTPARNGRPSGIYPALLAVKNPELYTELLDGTPADDQIKKLRRKYEARYCAAHATEHSAWDTTGAAFLEEFHKKFVGTPRGILRKLIDDCIDLPEKVRELVPVELNAQEERAFLEAVEKMWQEHEQRVAEKLESFKAEILPVKLEEEIKRWLRQRFDKKRIDNLEETIKLVPAKDLEDFTSMTTKLLIAEEQDRLKQADALVAMGQYRHAGSRAKARAAIEMTLQIFEEDAEAALEAERQGKEHKPAAVVVFCEFKDVAQQIADAFDCPVLSGDTPDKKRKPMIEAFQNGEHHVFVSIYGAGGVGITLHAAAHIILVGRPWTPGAAFQAEARIRRIGQTRTCLCQWLQIPAGINPVDSRIDEILQKKQKNISTMLDGAKENHDPNALEFDRKEALDLFYEATHFLASKESEAINE